MITVYQTINFCQASCCFIHFEKSFENNSKNHHPVSQGCGCRCGCCWGWGAIAGKPFHFLYIPSGKGKQIEDVERGAELSFSGLRVRFADPPLGINVKFCFQTTKFWLQTDRQTDRQTDGRTDRRCPISWCCCCFLLPIHAIHVFHSPSVAQL